MDEIDYKKWASMPFLTIYQLVFLYLGLNPDIKFHENVNMLLDQEINANFPYEEEIDCNELFEKLREETEERYEKALKTIKEIFNKAGYTIPFAQRIPICEIRNAFLKVFGEIPENLKFLFADEVDEKELLERVGAATIQNVDTFGIAQSRAIKILGTVVYILANEREKLPVKLTATGIWKYITQNDKKYANIAHTTSDRAKRLISKYLKSKQ